MQYWIDERDRIAAVDDEWLSFAAANGAPELTPESVRGRPLVEFISDPTTAALWEELLRRAREGRPLSIPIRCDAPRARRRLDLALEPDGPLLRVTSTTLAEEPRATVRLLETSRPSRGRHVVACSWCRRFEIRPREWVEVEDFVQSSDLFDVPVLPPVSHGICAECADWVKAASRPERLH